MSGDKALKNTGAPSMVLGQGPHDIKMLEYLGGRGSAHQRKSESRHLHTRDVSADVKLLPLTHQDVDFLFR